MGRRENPGLNNSQGTESSSLRHLNLALKGERDIEERVPYFALNFKLNFRVLIRPYLPGQVHSLIKDNQIDLDYKNQVERQRRSVVRPSKNDKV